MNNIYDYLLDPYKGLESYLEINRLFFFGRKDDQEKIINKLITHRLTILYGVSGVGKSSVLRAGVKHYFRQAAQENADIKGKPGLGVIVFPPVEGNLKDKISWQDPISGIKEQLKVEMETLGIKEAPSENLSLTDTLKAWIEIIRDDTGRSRLFIILDQFEEYFLLLSQQNGKDKAPLHRFAEEFPKAVNDRELSVNFLIAIREDSLSKIDYFKREIPNWFKNHIEIAPLNRNQAKEAIEKPIAEYNRQKIILNSLLSSRLTVLSGDRNTHKSTLLQLGIARYLRDKDRGCVLFNGWCKNEDWQTELKQQIQKDLEPLVKQSSQLDDRLTLPVFDLSLVKMLQKWRGIIEREKGKSQIFLILDQFEEYFRQQAVRDKDGALIEELLKAINDDSLNVNVLLSIRHDMLPELNKKIVKDCSNSLKHQFLYLYKDKDAEGIDRITKDLVDPKTAKPSIEVEIEPDLANEILNDFDKEQAEVKIEAPYLQLVMTRLWQEEKERIKAEKAFSLKLGKTTYTDLRLERILKEYLYKQIKQLDEGYRKMAVRILYYLVTPSGTQLLSLSSKDLTEFANQNRLSDEPKLDEKLVEQLLQQLSQGSSRILCPVEGDRYRIFFPVLAKEVLNWVQLKRQIKYIDREAKIALQEFESSQLKALLSAMRIEKKIKEMSKENELLGGDLSSPTINLQIALQKILDNIREKNQFEHCEAQIYSVSFSPDGKSLATGATDGTIRLWDLKGNQKAEFKAGNKSIKSIIFSPNGQYLATGLEDGTVCLWESQGERDKPSYSCKCRWKDHSTTVWSVSFSPDGQRLATASQDETARLWDLQGNEIAKLKGHDGPVYCISFSPDGHRLATASRDNTARLWDLQGNEIAKLEGHENAVNWLDFSHDGKCLATASWDGTVRLWDLEGKQQFPPLKGHERRVYYVSFIGDGQELISTSWDGTIRRWDVKGQQLAKYLSLSGRIRDVSISPNAQLLATAVGDGIVHLWDLQNEGKKTLYVCKGHKDTVWDVSFSPDGQWLATASEDYSARLWDLQGNPKAECKGHDRTINRVCFHPHENLLATASLDKTVRLWDFQGRERYTVLKHDDPVYWTSFSPDGQYLATAAGNTAYLWTWQDKPQISSSVYLDLELKHISFVSDNKLIAIICKNGTAYLWNVENQKKPYKLDLPADALDISVPAEGESFAIASQDGSICIIYRYDLQGKRMTEVKIPQEQFQKAYLSLDCQKLATSSVDGTVRLWNLEGRHLGEFKDHKELVWRVSFSPDGKYLATASDDGTAKIRQIKDLDWFLNKGFDWLKDYLNTHLDAKKELAALSETLKK